MSLNAQATAYAQRRNRLTRWSLRWGSECSWRAQLALFVLAYGLYTFARWVFVGDLRRQGSTRTGSSSAGVAVEASVQQTLGSELSIWLLNNVYLAAQLVVIPAALVFTYGRDQLVYRALRNTLLATWLIAIPIYALFPVAPPRLADVGLIDTVSQQSGVGLSGRSTMFYNPLAAVPSLHVGFATAIGIAVAAVLHRPWTKLAAAMWGPTVALAVVATGNHFVFDIAAGLAVTLAGVIAAAAPGYLRRRRPTPATG